jgi:hypothetical protein
MSIAKGILALVGLVLAVVALYVAGAWLTLYGSHEGPGELTEVRIPEEVVATRSRDQQSAASSLTSGPTKQILFGDLHVHTTFSTDAFRASR